jgi:hypothetical protein
MKKKRNYYVADTGFFGAKVHICFSDESFQEALRDAKITTRHNALDIGIAESHYIQQEGTHYSLLAIAFNFEDMAKEDALERMGTIYHEVSHTVTHIFQHVGEDEAKIGDESRSYLGEHLFKQVFAAYATEEDRREHLGKRNRKVSEQTNQAVIGALIQMAEQHNGSAGSDSIPKPKSVPRRTKNSNGQSEPKTSARIRRAG